MASGIKVDPDVIERFKAMKMNKKYKWCLFKISDDLKTIVNDESVDVDDDDDGKGRRKDKDLSDGETEERFEEFTNRLLSLDGARYCIFDCHYSIPEACGKRHGTKIALVNWCPDTLKVKEKMVFASTKDALKTAFSEGFKEFNWTSADDFDFKEVVRTLSK